MKYVVVNRKLTYINKVFRGTIARKFEYINYPVTACKEDSIHIGNMLVLIRLL